MSGTPGSEARSGIGARLKAARERMGLTLLQVAERLHMDAKAIEALEAERFDELGAPVYTKGHLKRYSELTGDNTQEILNLYAESRKPVLPDLTHIPKAQTSHTDPRKLLLPSLVVLIAFALIGSVWWVLQNYQAAPPAGPQSVDADVDSGTAAESPPPAAETPAPPSEAPAPETRPSPPPVASGGRPSATPPVVTTAAPGTSGTPAVSTLRGSGTRAGTSQGAASSTQITKTTRLPAQPPAADATPRGRSVDVTLKFAADSWVEVYDAKGERLFYDIGTANSSHAVTGTPPLRVVLGNAPGVTLNINGRAANVPASVVQNDSAQFTINRSGRIVRAQPDAAAPPPGRPNGE